MGLKQSKKALPEVIPPRICITFRRGSFWSRPKTWKMWIVKHPGRKHDKYRVRKPPQLFRKSQNSWKSVETGPIFDESGWESSHLNLKGATNPMGTLPIPQNCHRKFKIDQKSNGPHRPHCPLNLAINRVFDSFSDRRSNMPSPCLLTSHLMLLWHPPRHTHFMISFMYSIMIHLFTYVYYL